jgi:hypothetical protein
MSLAQARSEKVDDCKDMKLLLATIATESSEEKRDALSEQLPHVLMNRRGCGINPDIMDHISVLLADPSDVVRSWAAVTLGIIGPPAIRTVPALKKALRQSDSILDPDPSPFLPTQYSGQAIREALRKITHESIPEYNEEPGKRAPTGHPVN